MKSILWRSAKRLSYIEDAWCLKINNDVRNHSPRKSISVGVVKTL